MTLFFEENDWFSNESLTVSVLYKDTDADDVEKTTGTVINWKDGKDLTKKKVKKKQKHKKTNETRTIVKTVPCESIFNVFTGIDSPPEDDDDDDEPDEET